MLGVIAALLTAGAVYLLVRLDAAGIPTYGPSMRPTITGDQPVEVDTAAYSHGSPQIGDIVILQGPAGLRTEACGARHPVASPCPVAVADYDATRLIKRIVALPGDRVAFAADGHLIRNGVRQAEPFIVECRLPCALPIAVTIPADHFFVAGDNRPISSDSRYWGAVPRDAIDGRVVLGE